MAKGKRSAVILNKYGGTFTMPGHFKVRVEILNKDEAKDQMGTQVLAQYCQEEHLILLQRSRTSKQRMTDLAHELQHCCVDWVDHYIRKARCKK
jgi:hypothetical protein